jgi:phosphate uptake regulator
MKREETLDLTAEEIRKVQITGKSTYIVSLPKKWATSLGLKAGSQLAVSKQNGNSLVLTPKEFLQFGRSREGRIIVSQKDDPNTIARKIIALYLVGFNSIRIEARDERVTSAQRNLIKDLIRKKLVGTEIVSDSPKEMTLQVLFGYPELSVENALRRMALIAGSMHEDAIHALKSADAALAREVITLDDEVDRFSFYIIRQLKAAVQNARVLKEARFSSPTDCLGYRMIVKSVERTADHAVGIAEAVLALKTKIEEPVFRRLSDFSAFSRSIFDDSMKALHAKDYLLADSVVSKAETVNSREREVVRTLSKTSPVTRTSIRMIIESVKRTAEYASDIAEVVLNLHIEEVVSRGSSSDAAPRKPSI